MTLPAFLSTNQQRFAFTGDEWLIAYAQLSSSLVTTYPGPFSLSMVLELYLKAYLSFIEGPTSDVTRFSHHLDRMYGELQNNDPQFPTALRLRPDLMQHPLHELDAGSWQCPWYVVLPQDEQDDIRQNYEIYMAMAYGADLKYGVSPALPRDGGRIISASWSIRNAWLARFVIAVRRRIGYPSAVIDDRLNSVQHHPELNPQAGQYLLDIHTATFAP